MKFIKLIKINNQYPLFIILNSAVLPITLQWKKYQLIGEAYHKF